MNNLDKLVKLLDYLDGDYWSDVLSQEARAVIDRDVDQILTLVAANWMAWPEHRLAHLAYVLGESTSPVERQLVQELLKSPFEDVVFKARERARQLGLCK